MPINRADGDNSFSGVGPHVLFHYAGSSGSGQVQDGAIYGFTGQVLVNDSLNAKTGAFNFAAIGRGIAGPLAQVEGSVASGYIGDASLNTVTGALVANGAGFDFQVTGVAGLTLHFMTRQTVLNNEA